MIKSIPRNLYRDGDTRVGRFLG